MLFPVDPVDPCCLLLILIYLYQYFRVWHLCRKSRYQGCNLQKRLFPVKFFMLAVRSAYPQGIPDYVHASDEAAAAFETALTPEIYSTAWRYCCYLCSRREDSEDLLQDSIAHALRKFSQLRDQSSFKAWLLAVVRSRFITGLRRRKPVEEFGEEQLTVADDCRLLSDAVAVAMQELPDGQRELLTLFYIEDLQLTELATVLGVSVSVTTQRLFRARRALRRRLETQPVFVGVGSAPEEL